MKQKDTLVRIVGIGGLLILLGLVLWAQQESRPGGHDHADPAHHGQETEGTPLNAGHMESLTTSGQVASGIRIVEYDAFQYGFSPDPLVVQAGESVRLLLKSRDVIHGVMIPEVDVSADMPLDQRKPIEFTAPPVPGEYPVFCSVFCGPEHGNMTGRMIVIPAKPAHEDHHE
jgi:cytochrome c oxidase subunit 2